jgi:hypothetical protein
VSLKGKSNINIRLAVARLILVSSVRNGQTAHAIPGVRNAQEVAFHGFDEAHAIDF